MSAMFKPRNPAGGLRRGAWTHEEDLLLNKCIEKFGEGSWHMVPARAGLARCRKSCRLRWLNYLKPGLKRGEFGDDEIDLILRLHYLLGNRWALIAGRIPGRTANDIKNYWNSHLSKKVVTSDRHLGRAGSQLSRNVDSPKEEEERKMSKKRRRTAGDATAAAKKMGRVEETSKSNTTATTTTVTTDPRRITASGETSSVTVIKPQALTLAPDFCFRDKPAAAGLPRQAGIEEPWWASFCSDGGGAQGGSFGSGPTGGGDCHGAVEGREVQWEDMFLDPESLWKFV